MKEIKIRYKVSDTVFEKILVGLDKVDLIEFWSLNKIKLKAKWPFKWLSGGVLQKTYMKALLYKIFSTAYSRSESSGDAYLQNLFRPFELVLRDSSFVQLKKDLADILENYRSVSKVEMLTAVPSDLRDVTGLLISGSFSAWDEML